MAFAPHAYTLPITPASVAIQGQAGSFSHSTCRAVFNELNDDAIQFYDTFDEPFEAVVSGRAALAVIPVFNTIAGPVPYVHRLIRNKKLFAVGEYFHPIEMCLMGLPGANVMHITKVSSHIHALNQCRLYLDRHPYMERIVHADTGGSARDVAKGGDAAHASIASAFAAQLYGLKILERGVQDKKKNVTHFLILSGKPLAHDHEPAREYVTTFLIKPYRRIDRPLKAIIDVLSEKGLYYRTPMEFSDADMRPEEFLVEVFEHRAHPAMAAALKALGPSRNGGGISSRLDITGCYPAHHYTRFGRRRHAPG
ncbi:MAG: hypothetical protein H6865_07330 [Rhodospirillales bacterium]|nr:hypothetical protein [Alphaproteobacteria bacterium]MCB9987427.1 hypothetical protein [Rhodospirillales bacterium]USO07591.1 MAG: hypothetical protein H6866_09325 [Rhodospirillales bacterium]